MSTSSSFDSVNELADLRISEGSDSLQEVINGAYRADVRDGLVDGEANNGSSASSGDCSGGARASPGPVESSQSSDCAFPPNQEARWNQFYAKKRSQWHSTCPLEVGRAEEMVTNLSDSAKKIHDGYIGQGMVKHDLPPISDVSLDLDELPTPDVTSPFFITVPELVLSARSEFNRTFEIFGTTLDFVLVKRRADDFPWFIPSLASFADVVNVLQNRILEKSFRFIDVLVETRSWNGVGVLSLKVTCPLRLDFEGGTYNTFPKDALQTKDTQISVLLRSGLRHFQLKWVAHGLKLRNALKGKITVVYSKTYGPTDKTRAGFSKAGWRLVIADVDQQFMESYSAFPVGYGFRLGSSTVQIRPLMSNPEPELPPLGVPPQPLTNRQFVQQQIQNQSLLNHGLQRASREVRFPPPPPDVQEAARVSHLTFPTKVTKPAPSNAFPLVPELVRTISAPVPLSQVRPKTGPGSRGGKGRRAKVAQNNAIAEATAAAKKAYEAACDAIF